MKQSKLLILILVLFVFGITLVWFQKNSNRQDSIIITYYYGARTEKSIDIPINNLSVEKKIKEEIAKIDSLNIGENFEFVGKYHVTLDPNTWFEFSYADDNKIKLYKNNEISIQPINDEILKQIASIVDKKLEKETSCFNTNKITLSDSYQEKIFEDIGILSRIRFITKDFTWEEIQQTLPNTYDLKIDFQNGTIIYLVKEEENKSQTEGYMTKENKVYKIFNVDLLNGVLKEMTEFIHET